MTNGNIKKSLDNLKNELGVENTRRLNQIQDELNLRNNQQAVTKNNTTYLILQINDR